MNSIPYKPETFIGHMHLWVSLLGLVLLPLSGVLSQIGMGLICIGLLRIPTTFRTLIKLLRNPLVILLLFWWALAYLSFTWSIGSHKSVLATPVSILIIPALWPLMSKTKSIIFALAIGGCIHAIIQLLHWAGLYDGIRYAPFTLSGGLHWYPPYTGLWAITIFLLLLGIIQTSTTSKDRTWPIVFSIPLILSLVLTGNRALFILLPIAIMVVMVSVLTLPSLKTKRIKVAGFCIALSIVWVAFLLTADTLPNERLELLQTEYSTIQEVPKINYKDAKMYPETNYENSVALRYLWWRAGFQIWKKSPIIGHGSGSTMRQFAYQEAMMPIEFGANVSGFITPEPHSALLATSIEQGGLGAVSMVSLVILGILNGWKRSRFNLALAGISGAWIALAIFCVVHTIQFSAYAIPIVAILLVLSIKPKIQS